MNKPSQPQSEQEVVVAWKEQLVSLEETEDDQQVAYNMVGVLAANDWWWDEVVGADRQDTLMEEVFELVADLETPRVPAAKRKEMWTRVNQAVAELEEKYIESE